MRLLPLYLAAALAYAVSPGSARARDVFFAGYNVENYAPILLPGATSMGRPLKKPLKSLEAAAATVQVIRELSPDILGVCEMGARVQFEDFRARLAEAGLGYVDGEWVDGPDPDRHLALLSRLPILERHSVADLPLKAGEAGGIRQKVRRGFLDVTVEAAPGCRVRIVGAHLKSKLSMGGDSADLERRREAHELRGHIREILAADPGCALLVFGDFNDTRDQPSVQEVAGPRGAADVLKELPLADAVGDRWTHYWKAADVYSRIDYILVNRALAPRVVREGCGVYRTPEWNRASDHRPVFATFRFPDLK